MEKIPAKKNRCFPSRPASKSSLEKLGTLQFLDLAALLFFSKGKAWLLSGGLIGLTAAIKFYPLMYSLYFLFMKKFKIFIVVLLVFAFAYIAIPVFSLGFSAWLGFEKAVAHSLLDPSTLKNAYMVDVNSQNFTHVLLRWLNLSAENSLGVFLKNWGGIYSVLDKISGAIVLLVLGLCWKLLETSNAIKNSMAMIAIFALTPFIIKTSWPHYFCYLPILQLQLLVILKPLLRTRGPLAKTMIVLPIISMLLSSLPFFRLFSSWESYSSSGMLFIANALLLVPLPFFVMLPKVESSL